MNLLADKSQARLIDRRREALLIATRLQRRNVAARWGQLREHRVVGWAESGKSLLDALRGTPGLRGAAAGSLTALASTALWTARERSRWGLFALAAKWWWRRREQRRLGDETALLQATGLPLRRSLFSPRARLLR